MPGSWSCCGGWTRFPRSSGSMSGASSPITSSGRTSLSATKWPSRWCVWASVSEEVDAKIREQVQAGTFPIRLKAEDWNSGDINWLLDVIAPDQRTTANVIANFKQVVKEGSLRLHPIVTRLVDAETLQKMGAEKMGAPASAEREEATVN